MSGAPSFGQLLGEIREQLATLPDKPEESADATLRALWHAAAGVPKSAELACEAELPALGSAQQETLRSLIARRLRGVPLAHLTGRQRFLGLEMLAGPGALIPRKETELLAQRALELLREGGGAPNVIDVCTGAGNVALAIACSLPAARVYASDLSAEAVELARRNAAHLAVQARVQFRTGDLLAPFDTAEFHGMADMVTCNPPYIASANVGRMPEEIAAHEPRLAFDGGPFGVSVLMRLLRDAARFLRPSGWLAFEVGLGQGPSMMRLLGKHADYTGASGIEDERGAMRVIVAQRR